MCVGKDPEGNRINIFTVVFDYQSLQTKPLLVFVHGFAASAAVYYHMYLPLMEHFSVICFDMIGMGASSRPKNYDYKTI